MVALPKPPEDPKKSKGSLVVVLPAVVALLLLLLVKVSAEELVFIFEEEALIIKSDVSCVDEAKSNKVSKLEEDAEETAVVLDGLIRSPKMGRSSFIIISSFDAFTDWVLQAAAAAPDTEAVMPKSSKIFSSKDDVAEGCS